MRTWIRRFLGVTALAALFPTATSVAQKAPLVKEQPRAVKTAASAQTALFAKYPGFDSSTTRARLAALKSEPAQAKIVQKIADALANPKTTSATIQGDLLLLVKGLSYGDAGVVLDAIMREHYDRHVAGQANERSLKAMSKALERIDQTLDNAVYGKTTKHKFRRLARRHRRRM